MSSEKGAEILARDRAEYVLYRLVRSLIRVAPEGLRFRFGPWLGRLGFQLDRRHRRVAIANLQVAFPELDHRQLRRLARGSFESFGSAIVESIAMSMVDRDQLLHRCEVEGWHHLEAAEASDRGVMLITAHLGNWEALAQCLAVRGKPLSFVARPLDNPLIEHDLRQARERFGNQTIPKRSAARYMMRVLRQHGRVGILIDQRVHPNEGEAYPFFGRPAYTTPLPARLSLRTGAAALPFFGIPVDSWRRCRVVFYPPIWPHVGDRDPRSAIDFLTSRYLQIIEGAIRQQPELWLWMHRRWRKNPTRILPRQSSRRASSDTSA